MLGGIVAAPVIAKSLEEEAPSPAPVSDGVGIRSAMPPGSEFITHTGEARSDVGDVAPKLKVS